MNAHEFLNKLKQDMKNNINLMPEIPMPDMAHILFNGQPVKEYDLVAKLISLRENYGIDYVVALPSNGRPPMVRFWLIDSIKELPEDINEHNSDQRTDGEQEIPS